MGSPRRAEFSRQFKGRAETPRHAQQLVGAWRLLAHLDRSKKIRYLYCNIYIYIYKTGASGRKSPLEGVPWSQGKRAEESGRVFLKEPNQLLAFDNAGYPFKMGVAFLRLDLGIPCSNHQKVVTPKKAQPDWLNGLKSETKVDLIGVPFGDNLWTSAKVA